MNRCATCRHWEQHDDLPAGVCSGIVGLYDWEDESWSEIDGSPEVRGGDGGYLWTPADFGCTEWTAIPLRVPSTP